MLRDVIQKMEIKEMRSGRSDDYDRTCKLLEKYAPVLRFEKGEYFFPMSALMYIVCSNIWWIPAPAVQRKGKEWGEFGFRDLLNANISVQLELECVRHSQDQYWENFTPNNMVDKHPMPEWPGHDLVTAEKYFSERPNEYPSVWAIDIVAEKFERFMHTVDRCRFDKETRGILALHFADSIRGSWSRTAHFGLPPHTREMAKTKYGIISHGGQDVCYYGRVVDHCSYRILQYWFFYAFNDWFSNLPLLNKHEGDWECVFVFGLPDGKDGFTPTHSAYSSHHNSRETIRRPWQDIETHEETHPVVYVGRGSHANYYSPGRHHHNLDTAYGKGRKITPEKWGAIRTILPSNSIGGEGAMPNNLNRYVRENPGFVPDWLFFEGFWGAYIRDITTMQNAPFGPKSSAETGSSRPRHRSQWYRPREWAGLPCIGGASCKHIVIDLTEELPPTSSNFGWSDWHT